MTPEMREMAMLMSLLDYSIYGALCGLFVPLVAIVWTTGKVGWKHGEVKNAMDSAKKGLTILMGVLILLTGCLAYFNDAHTVILYPARFVAAGSLGLALSAGLSISLLEGMLVVKRVLGIIAGNH